MENEKNFIYHERQKLQFCLLHSLNNLFQDKNAFTRGNLNSLAGKLGLDDPNKTLWTPLSLIFTPHHNALTGNYDVNVLIAALEEKGKMVTWHDRRSRASSINLDGLFGIVLNIPVKRYGGLLKSRHWVALRRIDNTWYNFDSDFSTPYAFEDPEELKEFLDGVVSKGGEILLVVNRDE